MHVFMLNGEEEKDFCQSVFTVVGTCKCTLTQHTCIFDNHDYMRIILILSLSFVDNSSHLC